MGKIFGTDGARGIAGTELSANLAMNIGKATAYVLGKNNEKRPTVIVGKDTRKSSDMLELAVCAGLMSCGANVIKVGVLPTPAIAYLVTHNKADAGIMISASHNSYEYNGIKIFGSKGYKLLDKQENEIEDILLGKEQISENTFDKIGTYEELNNAYEVYTNHILSVGNGLCAKKIKVLIDCCNGSAAKTAKCIFDKIGCECVYVNIQPNGININDNCGSTHIENLKKMTVDGEFDLAVAFDGDADRCLAVDNKGEIVTGDELMAVFAMYLKEKQMLKNNTVVATVMSNLGFFKFGEEYSINVNTTKVGDRYVLENMLENGHCLGGEDSGHLIFLDHMTTGDGQLSALYLIKVLCESEKTLNELKKVMKKYPQLLINIKVTNDIKQNYSSNEKVKQVIEEEEKRLGNMGRVLVRASGTEPLVRVMVEAQTNEETAVSANRIADVIKNLL